MKNLIIVVILLIYLYSNNHYIIGSIVLFSIVIILLIVFLRNLVLNKIQNGLESECLVSQEETKENFKEEIEEKLKKEFLGLSLKQIENKLSDEKFIEKLIEKDISEKYKYTGSFIENLSNATKRAAEGALIQTKAEVIRCVIQEIKKAKREKIFHNFTQDCNNLTGREIKKKYLFKNTLREEYNLCDETLNDILLKKINSHIKNSHNK